MKNLQVFLKTCFLLEGGNAGERIIFDPETKPQKRKSLTLQLYDFFKILNEKFKNKYHLKLFKDQEISTILKHFSGSSRHFMNLDLEDYPKDSLGDIDLMINRDLKDSLVNFLNSLGKEKIAGIQFNHFHNLPSSEISQLITVWDLPVQDKTLQLQIDFEFVDVDEEGFPTVWSEFSHSSNLLDLQKGIKGSFHKLLIRAINKKDIDWNIYKQKKDFDEHSFEELKKGKVSDDSFSLNGWDSFYSLKTQTKTLKVPENKYSFSVDLGLRPNLLSKQDESGKTVYLNISSQDIKEISQDDTLLQKFLDFLNKDTKQKIKKQELKDFLIYEKNLINIIKTVFSSSALEKDLEDEEKAMEIIENFSSFLGLVVLINKYLSLQQKENIIYHFAELLWGWTFYKTSKKNSYQKGDKRLLGQELFLNPSPSEIHEDSSIKMNAFCFLLSPATLFSKLEKVSLEQALERRYYTPSLLKVFDPLISTYKSLYFKKSKKPQ